MSKIYTQFQGVLICQDDPFDKIHLPLPSYTPKPKFEEEHQETKKPTHNAFGKPIDDFSVPDDLPPVDYSEKNEFGHPIHQRPDGPLDAVADLAHGVIGAAANGVGHRTVTDVLDHGIINPAAAVGHLAVDAIKDVIEPKDDHGKPADDHNRATGSHGEGQTDTSKSPKKSK